MQSRMHVSAYGHRNHRSDTSSEVPVADDGPAPQNPRRSPYDSHFAERRQALPREGVKRFKKAL
jgi:hypothetical protein